MAFHIYLWGIWMQLDTRDHRTKNTFSVALQSALLGRNAEKMSKKAVFMYNLYKYVCKYVITIYIYTYIYIYIHIYVISNHVHWPPWIINVNDLRCCCMFLSKGLRRAGFEPFCGDKRARTLGGFGWNPFGFRARSPLVDLSGLDSPISCCQCLLQLHW